MTNPYAPPESVVHDVDAPQDATDLAERGARLVAAIVDNVIFAAMVYLPLMLAMAGEGGDGTQGNPTLALIGIVLTLVGAAAWCWLTFPGMAHTGQSIAKRMLKIRVVRTDGSQASLSRLIWLRNGVVLVLSMIPLVGVVDALFIFGESRQCLHDKIADTIVIKA